MSCRDVICYNNIKQSGKYSSDFMQNFAEKKHEYCCVVQMYGLEHTQCFWWFPKRCCRFLDVQSFQFEITTHLTNSWNTTHTGQTVMINWSKIQLSWVFILYYPYKTMFYAYKSVIVSPCACDLFVSKVTKITRYMDVRFWRSFFGAFSVCDDCILKSTKAWLLKLSVLYIHSFMQVHNTTF